MREIYTCEQSTNHVYPPGKLGLWADCGHFFWHSTSQNFSREQLPMKYDQQTDFQQKIVSATTGLTGTRLSLHFQDLTQIDCNKLDQVYDVLRYIKHLPPQPHEKCRQSWCGAQPHKRLMMQQFVHQNSVPVYP